MASMDKFRNSVASWVNIIYNVGVYCSNNSVYSIFTGYVELFKLRFISVIKLNMPIKLKLNKFLLIHQ